MSKRVGRPAKNPAQRKSIQTSVRLTKGTVEALERAARANGKKLAREVADRLEDSLEATPKAPNLFGGRKTYSFALLLALSLKQLKELTGHWWHEDPFTFEHARVVAEALFDYCRPPGRSRVPRDLPGSKPGQVRRASSGLSYSKSRFGAEAAAELVSAMEAFSSDYGAKYERMTEHFPESQRYVLTSNVEFYRRLGRSLMPLHARQVGATSGGGQSKPRTCRSKSL